MARKYRYSKRRIGIMLLILFLLLGGIGWGIAFLFQKIDEQDKTMVLTFGELDLSGEHPAVVIRNEMIIQTNANGSLAYFVESGELVERNDPIMEIFNDSTAQEQEATIIPEQGQLSGETAKVALDYERNEYELQQKRDRILALIRKGDYYGASVEKEEFHLLMDAHEKMRSDHQFLARNQISFREKTIGERLLPNQRLTVFAPVSGLLSFAIDGLEDTVKPNLAMTLDVSAILNRSVTAENLRRDYARSGERLFRLVDSSQYHLLLQVSREELETYRYVDSVSVTIGGEVLEANIQEVNVQGEYGVVLLRLHAPFRGYQDIRTTRCRLEVNGYRGVLVPNEAILQSNGVDGVYRVNAERVIEFVPIKVLKFGAESAIIQHGRFFDAKLGEVSTIEIGQEIIRRPTKHSIGERVE